MLGMVTINITEAEIVTSPSYDIGADPDQLTDHWLRRHAAELGYSVAKIGER